MRRQYRRTIAFVMVMVTLAISVSALCCSASACASPDGASVQTEQGAHVAQLSGCHDDCPACPDQGHSDSHDCDSCDCDCHSSLPQGLFHFVFLDVTTPLRPHEPFRFLPDVYLSRFIPPQNHA